MSVIAVDFDGTIVRHDFPEIGPEVPGALAVLDDLHEAGHTLLLHTARTEEYLFKAEEWCRAVGIHFDNYQDFIMNASWGHNNRKIAADYFIDDRGAGVPLNHDNTVDWVEIRKDLVRRGFLAS